MLTRDRLLNLAFSLATVAALVAAALYRLDN